jgi:hypothetical protein
MGQAPWNPGDPNDIVADFDLQGYDVKAGDIITATGNGTSKTLTVSALEVTDFDLENDLVSGKGTTGAQVQVCANVPDRCITRWVTPNASGDWTANYHDPGTGNDDPDTFDVKRTSNGWAAEYEEDSDRTWYDWNVPNPNFGARPDEERVEGFQWPLGATVTITIDDPATPLLNPDFTGQGTAGVAPWNPNETWFELYFTGQYDLKPGDLVTFTHGDIIKTHTVTSLTFTSINPVTDIVSGTTDTAGSVDLWICWEDGCVNRNEPVTNGIWSANFGIPGDENWEQGTYDIQFGTNGDSAQWDDDGDGTMVGWRLPDYTLHAVPTHPEVHGHDWPSGANVTLTIDDDTNPDNGVLYTRTKNADDDPWCGYPCFDLAGAFNLQVGQYVTMTDGVITKTVHVSTLKIMFVDYANDKLSGVADPGSDVMVNIWSQDGKARHTVADANGRWMVDFSVFGDEDFEQFTTDITRDDNGRAIQLNPDGTDDGTLEYWPIPSPVTPILDNFNRPNGPLGPNWKGSVSYYRILGNRVDVRGNGPIYWKNAFGVNQEAYVTFTTVDAAGREQNLLLKVQGGVTPNWGKGVIEVLYSPKTKTVTVWTFRPDTLKWFKYASIPVTFANGDLFSAQALATGEVVIFKNGVEVGRVTLNSADQRFFNPRGGYIGLWFVNAPNAFFDDFGGGNMP